MECLFDSSRGYDPEGRAEAIADTIKCEERLISSHRKRLMTKESELEKTSIRLAKARETLINTKSSDPERSNLVVLIRNLREKEIIQMQAIIDFNSSISEMEFDLDEYKWEKGLSTDYDTYHYDNEDEDKNEDEDEDDFEYDFEDDDYYLEC